MFTYCNPPDEVRVNPQDNLRVIGVVSRADPKWDDLYSRRQSIKRFFNSAKYSRLLDQHRYRGKPKVTIHVQLSIIAYLATAVGRAKTGELERIRHMRVKLAS